MAESFWQELEARLGRDCLVSLVRRHLVPIPEGASRRGGAVAEAGSRAVATLVAAAAGSALGLPYEWREPPAGDSGPVDMLPAPGATVGADVTLLALSLLLMLDHGVGAPPTLSDRLAAAPSLGHAGRAVPATIGRRRNGWPWFEAGVPSLGNGALLRAVAAGLVYADRPERRQVMAALDAVVTHATPEASVAAVAVAQTVAALLAAPPAGFDLLGLTVAVPRTAAAVVTDVAGRLARGDGPPPSGATALAAYGAALFHAFRHPADPVAAVASAIASGGDTDTVAALAAAFAGAAGGRVPDAWGAVQGAAELSALAGRLALPSPLAPSGTAEPGPARGAALHIHFLLDRSGSMQSIASDVVGGFAAFLATHRAAGGDCVLTVAQFDSEGPFEVLVDAARIGDAPDLDPSRYQPRGTTPLYDAIGAVLDHAEADAARRPDRDHLVVVFTDGLENASGRWDRHAIFARIEQLKARGFTFAFLGANQDSYREGAGIGVDAGSVSNFRADATGTRAAWASLERATLSHRGKTHFQRRSDQDRFFEGIKEAEQPDGNW